MEKNLKIIYSLHRPLSEPIWICKWICQFISSKQCPKLISQLPIAFYSFFVEKMDKYYKEGKLDTELSKGIPSESAILTNMEYIHLNANKLSDSIHSILLQRSNATERIVYSVYKATSYYINLAYKVFELFDSKFTMSDAGKELSRRPFYPSTISKATSNILFNLILREDANFFIPLCIAKKQTADKSEISDLVYSYLRVMQNVTKFNYGKSSLGNYIDVRLTWMAELKVLDKNHNIRKSLIKFISSNKDYRNIFEESRAALTAAQAKLSTYFGLRSRFLRSYQVLAKDSPNPDGFVNLYDIMEKMHLRYARFQEFLIDFFKYEHRNDFHIFATNFVTSIDNRKRFNIGGIEALLIRLVKIK